MTTNSQIDARFASLVLPDGVTLAPTRYPSFRSAEEFAADPRATSTPVAALVMRRNGTGHSFAVGTLQINAVGKPYASKWHAGITFGHDDLAAALSWILEPLAHQRKQLTRTARRPRGKRS